MVTFVSPTHFNLAMPRSVILVATLFFCLVSSKGVEADASCIAANPYVAGMKEAQLARRLMCGYEKHTRPEVMNCPTKELARKFRVDEVSCDGSSTSDVQDMAVAECPLVIENQLFVNALWGRKEGDQTFIMEVFFRVSYVDIRLAWNETATGVSSLNYPINQIGDLWKPDVYIEQAIATSTSLEAVTLSSDGTVYWSRRQIVTIICPMDFRKFPFDTQECPVSISSYSYSVDSILMTPFTDSISETGYTMLDINSHFRDAQISLSVNPVDENRVAGVLICYKEGDSFKVYPSSESQIEFERFASGWMLKAVLPANAVMILVMITFWIDPKAAPARVALGVISILTAFNLENTFSRNLPQLSYSTWLDGYIRGYMVLAVLALAEYGTVHTVMLRTARIAGAQAKLAKDGAESGTLNSPARTGAVGAGGVGSGSGRPPWAANDEHGYGMALRSGVASGTSPAAMTVVDRTLPAVPLGSPTDPLAFASRPAGAYGMPGHAPAGLPLVRRGWSTGPQPSFSERFWTLFEKMQVSGYTVHDSIDYHSRWLWLVVIALFNIIMFATIAKDYREYKHD